MSYWIYLNCACCKRPMHVERHSEGGAYKVGGTSQAELNVTYNYSAHFDFKQLDGKTASDMVPIMEQAVRDLGTERSPDYWQPTPGNAGYAVSILLAWAKQNPAAYFEVS